MIICNSILMIYVQRGIYYFLAQKQSAGTKRNSKSRKSGSKNLSYKVESESVDSLNVEDSVFSASRVIKRVEQVGRCFAPPVR